MSARQHGADQSRVFVRQVGEESQDGSQAAVDGGRLEAARDLAVDKPVDVSMGDLGR